MANKDKKDLKQGISCSTYVNMTGGIYINNIEHVEHLHPMPEEEPVPKQAADKHDPALLAKLLPIFKKNDAEVRSFLQTAKNSVGVAITNKVTELVALKKIDPFLAKGDLYQILHSHGLYQYSKSNWNKQVKI